MVERGYERGQGDGLSMKESMEVVILSPILPLFVNLNKKCEDFFLKAPDEKV